MTEKPNTYGVDINAPDEVVQAFKEYLGPATSALFQKLGYYMEYDVKNGVLSVDVTGPFPDVSHFIKHQAGVIGEIIRAPRPKA